MWASLGSKGASRWFGWCRTLLNNASSAASKISVISFKSGAGDKSLGECCDAGKHLVAVYLRPR